MGLAGHALEVEAHNLFAYNGFTATANHQTLDGEVDVFARWKTFDVFVECKEFNPSSAASVTRDMIAGIAKKAEAGGAKNAMLVTTKPPSQSLQEAAVRAGVILRSYADLQALQANVARLEGGPETRAQFLVDSLNLVDDAEGATRSRRREFLKLVVSGKATKAGMASVGIEWAQAHRRTLLAVGLPILAALALVMVLLPAVRNAVIGVVVVAVFLGYVVVQALPKKKRRSK